MKDVIISKQETHPHPSKLTEFIITYDSYIKSLFDISLKFHKIVPNNPIEHPIGMMAVLEVVYRRSKISSRLIGGT